MQRYFQAIFSLLAVLGAAFLLTNAIQSIRKNTPKDQQVEVKRHL